MISGAISSESDGGMISSVNYSESDDGGVISGVISSESDGGGVFFRGK